MARYPFSTECDEMELILIGVTIGLVATAVDVYCAFRHISDLPEPDISDETA
jgi:hypothetical protein